MEAFTLCCEILQNRLYGGYPQIFHFSEKSVLSTYLDISFKSWMKVRCVEKVFFYPPLILDFSIDHGPMC